MDPNNQAPNNTNSQDPSTDLNQQYQDILNKYAEELAKATSQVPEEPATPQTSPLTNPAEVTAPTFEAPAAPVALQPAPEESMIDLSLPAVEPQPILVEPASQPITPPAEPSVIDDLVPAGPQLTSSLPAPEPPVDVLAQQPVLNSPSTASETVTPELQPAPASSDIDQKLAQLTVSLSSVLGDNPAEASAPDTSQPLESSPVSPELPPREPLASDTPTAALSLEGNGPLPPPPFDSTPPVAPIPSAPTPKAVSGGGIFKVLFFLSLIVFLGVSAVLAYSFIQNQNSTPSGAAPTPTVSEQSSVPSGESCELNDTSYGVGESFPAADGCNTCSCQPDLTIACTEKDCSAESSAITGSEASPAAAQE